MCVCVCLQRKFSKTSTFSNLSKPDLLKLLIFFVHPNACNSGTQIRGFFLLSCEVPHFFAISFPPCPSTSPLVPTDLGKTISPPPCPYPIFAMLRQGGGWSVWSGRDVAPALVSILMDPNSTLREGLPNANSAAGTGTPRAEDICRKKPCNRAYPGINHLAVTTWLSEKLRVSQTIP